MRRHILDIGVVTDGVALDMANVLPVCAAWGVRRFTLRRGRRGRFPYFTEREVRLVEHAVGAGATITAVSPGVFRGEVGDAARLRHEVEVVWPASIEMARRFGCGVLIAHGFAHRLTREEAGLAADRAEVLRALAQLAEAASEAGMVVALENAPGSWVDRPQSTAALLAELGHPALRLNWDPAHLYYGGYAPTHADFLALAPFLAHLHVKDYAPDDPAQPWRPVGRGAIPWGQLLGWLIDDATLGQLTIDMGGTPGIAATGASVDGVHELLASRGRGEPVARSRTAPLYDPGSLPDAALPARP